MKVLNKKIVIEFENCEGLTVRRKVSSTQLVLISKIINITIIKKYYE